MIAMIERQNDDPSTWTKGRLTNNGSTVRNLQDTLAAGQCQIEVIPSCIRAVLRDRAWLGWRFPNQEASPFSAKDFRTFLTTKRPEGAGADLAIIEKVLRGTDVWEAYCEAMAGKPGAPEGNQNNVIGANQWTNTNNVSDCPDAPIILPHPARDRSNDAPAGNSTIYTVNRLAKERPDLLDKIKIGELTPNAAAIAAGFRSKSITIPDEPEAAARRLLRHFQADRLEALLAMLANHAGFELIRK